jgi:cation diffusion facilitator CzcD-associated flavoprotein CzcO
VAGSIEHFDAVVIGAGFSGMYMLKSLRDKLGLKVRVYEEAETVGGTCNGTVWARPHIGAAQIVRGKALPRT